MIECGYEDHAGARGGVYERHTVTADAAFARRRLELRGNSTRRAPRLYQSPFVLPELGQGARRARRRFRVSRVTKTGRFAGILGMSTTSARSETSARSDRTQVRARSSVLAATGASV